MIHYHGTPIGGKADSAARFMTGRFVLIPWKSPGDLAKAMECSRGFVVDNSAFSFWSSGEKPNWFDYMKWVDSFCRHPRFGWCIIPDVIDGSESENDMLIDRWHRWMGQLKSGKRLNGVPVWHMHESIDRLRKMARLWPRIAIGSSGEWPTPGVGRWWDRMDEAVSSIIDEDGYPICKIHGLRMLRGDIVERYPFSSCDSTNAAQNGCTVGKKLGVETLWGQTVIAERTESRQSPGKFESEPIVRHEYTQHEMFSEQD